MEANTGALGTRFPPGGAELVAAAEPALPLGQLAQPRRGLAVLRRRVLELLELRGGLQAGAPRLAEVVTVEPT
jgi:hypothetical protein